jgi:Signal transduction histidine kinase
MKPYSLRKRLWVSVLLTTLFFWFVALGAIFGTGWHIANRLMNQSLHESGMLILKATTDFHERGILPERLRQEPVPSPSHRMRGMQYQIVSGGQVISRTQFAPEIPFVADFQERRGFVDIENEGLKWRIFVVKNRGGNFEVQVGRPLAPYIFLLLKIGEHLIIPALLLLLALATISWWMISRLLAPLNQAAQKLTEKSPNDLTPVVVDHAPNEMLPLLESLNSVLSRLATALESERRFTADAAHELRTPLAALGMKAQLLERQRPELAPALAALSADIQRSTALIEQLLLLARLDPLHPQDSGALLFKKTNIHDLLEKQIAAYKSTAAQRHITLKVEADRDLEVAVNPDLIAIALRNLIDNAMRYIDDGCTVIVRAAQKDTSWQLSVTDNGPGVAPEHYQHLTERFFRVLGSGKPGSGLGLSIVNRVAELHHGTLTFTPGHQGKGFSAILTMPFTDSTEAER